jgi:Fic family protein
MINTRGDPPRDVTARAPGAAGTRWPAHRHETRTWHQSLRGGTREDRALHDIIVWRPPRIATQHLAITRRLAADIKRCMREIAALESEQGPHVDGLRSMLLRGEAVAAARIARVDDVTEYAQALSGVPPHRSFPSVTSAAGAIDSLVASVDGGADLTVASLLAAHRALVPDHVTSRGHHGLRQTQTWIGGSDHSPRLASYVPPPPETLEADLTDLLAFSNRIDMPVLVQAAVAHAQFHSIHPFASGNGELGFALFHAVLHRRTVTSTGVVPLASALVSRRTEYLEVLARYRGGDPRPLVRLVVGNAHRAAREARQTAQRMSTFPLLWREALGPVPAHSAAARLLTVLPQMPVLTAGDADVVARVAKSALYRALDDLVEAGVLRPMTDRARKQVWAAGDMLDELYDLNVRLAATPGTAT